MATAEDTGYMEVDADVEIDADGDDEVPPLSIIDVDSDEEDDQLDTDSGSGVKQRQSPEDEKPAPKDNVDSKTAKLSASQPPRPPPRPNDQFRRWTYQRDLVHRELPDTIQCMTWVTEAYDSLDACKLKIRNTTGDGSCGFYSVIDGLNDGDCCPKMKSLQGFDDRSYFLRMMELRRLTANFIRRNTEQLTDIYQSWFIDELNRPYPIFRNKPADPNDKGGYLHPVTKEVINEYNYTIQTCYNDGMSKLKPGDWTGKANYLMDRLHLPVLSLMWGQSILYYAKSEEVYHTTLHFYRPDGRVQIFDRRRGYIPPFKGLAVVRHDGRQHYESCFSPKNEFLGIPPVHDQSATPISMEEVKKN